MSKTKKIFFCEPYGRGSNFRRPTIRNRLNGRGYMTPTASRTLFSVADAASLALSAPFFLTSFT